MSVHITPRLALELILVRLNSGRKKSSLDTIFFIYRFAMNEPTGRDCTVVAELQETRGVFPIFSLVSIPYPVFPSVTSQEPMTSSEQQSYIPRLVTTFSKTDLFLD